MMLATGPAALASRGIHIQGVGTLLVVAVVLLVPAAAIAYALWPLRSDRRPSRDDRRPHHPSRHRQEPRP